jgi:hypothetical protein
MKIILRRIFIPLMIFIPLFCIGETIEQVTSLANSGDADAQNRLAIRYENGDGVQKNLTEAFNWFVKSANSGNKHGQHNLGAQYFYGKGTDRNYDKAFYWFSVANKNNSLPAKRMLGFMYYEGSGTESNYDKSAELFLQAAVKGEVQAMEHIGWMYLMGQGVEQNNQKSLFWYKQYFKSNSLSAVWFGHKYLIHSAIEQHNGELVKLLIKQGADINIQVTVSSESPLKLAIKTKQLELFKILYSKEASLGYWEEKTNTKEIHVAALHGATNIIEYLLAESVSIEQLVGDQTPLSYALMGKNLNTVKFLIAKGADHRKLVSLDETYLHKAVRINNIGIAEYMIELGIDLNTKNFEGKTALDLADVKEYKSIINLLEAHGAKRSGWLNSIFN